VAHLRRSPQSAFIVLAALAALAGCERGDSHPTPTPTNDDTFVIVTATTGTSAKKTPTVEGARIYVVEDGDTLSSIAVQFGVTEEALIQLNNLTDPDDVEVGQVLLIPPAAAPD
jgi:LysM repeat protein